MRAEIRMAFSFVLLLSSIGLAILAATPDFEFVGREELVVDVRPMNDTLVELDVEGVVVATCNATRGVELYLLSDLELERYRTWGSLPHDKVDEVGESVMRRDPVALVVRSEFWKPVVLVVELEVYRQHMPYALLSIPAYALSIGGIGLLFYGLFEFLKSKYGYEEVGEEENA